MNTYYIGPIRLTITGCIIAALFAVMPFVASASTHDETPDLSVMWAQVQELLTLIESLQAQIIALQTARTPVVASPASDTLALHTHVEVRDGPLRVRDAAGGQPIGRQLIGATGKVMDGPYTADGYTWWYVDFTAGVSGYVAATYLTATAPPTTMKPAPDKPVTDDKKDQADRYQIDDKKPASDTGKLPVKKDTEDTEDTVEAKEMTVKEADADAKEVKPSE